MFSKCCLLVCTLLLRFNGFYGDILPTCSTELFDDFVLESSSDDISSDNTVCGIQHADRIHGGIKTNIDEHPWIALLHYQSVFFNGFFCSGALISRRYVLTAAHCALIPDMKLDSVRLGEWNTHTAIDCTQNECAPPHQDIIVAEKRIHENYSRRTDHNDIALLRLAKDAKYNDFVIPICLPSGSDVRSYKGFMFEVAGWGETEKKTASKIKLKVKVPFVSNQHCSQVYRDTGKKIIDKQLCAGGVRGKDSCIGDSGGPLMANIKGSNWVVIGVVSYGPTPCGEQGWPGVYTRVDAYLDWIQSKIRS